MPEVIIKYKVENNFPEFERDVRRAIQRGVQRGGRKIARELRRRIRAKIPVRTGYLKRALTVRSIPSRSKPGSLTLWVTGQWGSYDAWYWNIVNKRLGRNARSISIVDSVWFGMQGEARKTLQKDIASAIAEVTR